MNIDKKKLLNSLENRIRFLKDNSKNQETIRELEYWKNQIENKTHDIKVWE